VLTAIGKKKKGISTDLLPDRLSFGFRLDFVIFYD
jgi:hypothetical protein